MVSYFLLTLWLQSFDLSYVLHIVIIHKGHLVCGNCTDCCKFPLQLVLHQTKSSVMMGPGLLCDRAWKVFILKVCDPNLNFEAL